MSPRVLSIWLFAAMVAAGLVAPAAASPPPGGIYAIVDAASPDQYDIVEDALQQPGVDGLLIHLRWNQISTARMQYTWTSLDRTIQLATDADKRFEIGIVTGAAMPAWITDPPPAGLGARHATFHYDAVDAGHCATFVMAAPYDAAYLAAFRDFLGQLAKHLRSTGTYAALSMLKLDGITTTTNELRLPALAQCGGDAVREWQKLGYTPAKVQDAWDAMLQSYLDYFPDKSFNIGFIGINAFPGIEANGQAATTLGAAEALSAQLAAALIAHAGDAMPGHLALGFDSLTLNLPSGDTSYARIEKAFFADAAAAGARLGWQTNELLGNYPKGGAACGGSSLGNAVACTGSAEFQAMLFRGIYNPLGQGYTSPAMQAVYLELFPQNIIAYPSAVRAARQNLAEWNGDD